MTLLDGASEELSCGVVTSARPVIGALQNKRYTLLGSNNSLKTTWVEMGGFLLVCEGLVDVYI
jgi:hypothetical protein